MPANSVAGRGKAPGPGAKGDRSGRERRPRARAPSAIDGLYQSQSPRLLRMLRRRVADGEEAQDMLHEIFVRVARLGSSRMAALDRPEAYLSRMASNLLMDRARKGSTRVHSVAIEECDLPSGVDPVSHLETRDMLCRIEGAMQRLKPRTREIFMAHRLDGMSYGEIAERFGITVKGVEKQMSKAIAQIDRMLDRR